MNIFIRQQMGFTVIEILVTMVIISIVFIGVIALSIGIIQGNSFSRNITTATVLAQDQIENIKRLGFHNAKSIEGTENYGTIAELSPYKRITLIEQKPESGKSEFRTATVKVLWKSDKHSVSIKTLLVE